MIVFSASLSTPTRHSGLSAKSKESDYSRFFEAGRDAAVIGDCDAQAAHGLVATTKEQLSAWDAGRWMTVRRRVPVSR